MEIPALAGIGFRRMHPIGAGNLTPPSNTASSYKSSLDETNRSAKISPPQAIASTPLISDGVAGTLLQEQEAKSRDEPKGHNLTATTVQEFHDLWISGDLGLSGLPPIILPSAGIDLTQDTRAQMEAARHEKFDAFEWVTQRIDFLRSVNQSTAQYDEILSALRGFQKAGV